eukprot:Phypoly_transcript_14815.p1 GENE.Phypoly_transcript_14815~~Phypoly_transcript_14815.p1  ORF type:complete len:277 (+),score=27.15 Phypoly_transcript_14815:128-958(+)
MKKILVTNDDGITAPGLHALVAELAAQKKYDIRVCAPEKEQSAVSHAITVRKPIYSEDFEFPHDIASIKACKVTGTPADCVRIALNTDILGPNYKPDIVLSGINRGNNSGFHVIYSGTVGGAREGAVYGIPSMALSLNHPPTYPSREDVWPFDIAAQESVAIIDEFLEHCAAEGNAFLGGTILNVNFPCAMSRSQIKGTKITKQGCSRFLERFEESTASQGTRRCFTLVGEIRQLDTSMEFDTYAMNQGYIAITPLTLYSTSSDLAKFNGWFGRKQ